MEEIQESKFICRFCNKKYPCGKSLGGHMRSHGVAADDKFEPTMKKFSPSLIKNGSFFKKESSSSSSKVDYKLRENPKKTWRAVDKDFPLPQERICKQCGKVFQSLKALCGHMACHSDKERSGTVAVKDDHSWSWTTSSDTEVEVEAEEEERKLRSKSKSKRYKRIVIKSSSSFSLPNDSSSVSEIDEQEQEDIAISLMMLSRDLGNKGGVHNSVLESSDNNSVVLETKSSSIDTKIGVKKVESSVFDPEIAQEENSDSGYFLAEASDSSVHKIRRNVASFLDYKRPKPDESVHHKKGYKVESKKRMKDCYDDTESYKRMKYGSVNTEVKRNRYECLNCKKIFKSYQALGGHRPCHKRFNAYSQSRYENGENSSDAEMGSDRKKQSVKEMIRKPEKKIKSKKHKGHVCPFCNRVFKSGQALGGHKRSHFLGGNEGSMINQSAINKPENHDHDLFDLNLPAPLEDEDEGEDGHGNLASW